MAPSRGACAWCRCGVHCYGARQAVRPGLFTGSCSLAAALFWLQDFMAQSAVAALPASQSARHEAPDTQGGQALVAPHVRAQLNDFHLEGVVSHLLRRAHFLAEDLFAQEFADEAMTPRQKAALIAVFQKPGLSQNALADRLYMDRNTVADMVRRLVGAKLLLRITAPDDQRAYQLFLAPAGAALLNRVMPRDAEVEARVLARLPEEYRPLFMKCLRMLVDPAIGNAND